MGMKKQKLVMKDNLEIERKFLLKRLPNFNRVEVSEYLIHQIYVNVDGETVRFRVTEKVIKKGEKESVKYVKCVKHPISLGIFEEIENEISKEFFEEMCEKDHTFIIKTRYVHKENGLNWETDFYHHLELATLEVELDDIKQDIEIPEIYKSEIISEVTGQKEFSNQSLSIKERHLA